jgi:pimeloyl-ACP methyl ester carboxylesterase
MTAEQFIHFLPAQLPQPKAPLLIYLPGMDGTGKLLRSQIPSLEQSFDVRRLSIPVDDLTDWDRMVAKIIELMKTELGSEIPRRAVYLCGESFGGCLALKLAIAAPELCDRLILINPASSFKQQPWLRWGTYFTPLLPANLYSLSCIVLLPFLAALERICEQDRQTLLQVMQSVQFKSAMWRISLLDRFDVSVRQLRQLTHPTLVISSGRDRLLPSAAEGKLLTYQIPRSSLHLIPEGGHAVLLERDVNLHEILCQHGFLCGGADHEEKRKEPKSHVGLSLDSLVK